MKENVARDLFALAAHAFNRKDYEAVGQLVTLSLSNPDAPAFVDHLLTGNDTCGVLAESISNSVDDVDDVSKTIAQSISNSARSAKRKALRSDEEDFNDMASQSFDESDAEEETFASVSSAKPSVASPLKVTLK